MVVKFNKYKLAMSEKKQQEAHKTLKDTYKDGKEIFKRHSTPKDMVMLAGICQELAKFPLTKQHGRNIVHSGQFLYEALDYLYYGLSSGDRPDFYWLYRKASCLYDLGELNEAVEWQKKAWLCSHPTQTNAFSTLCIFCNIDI